MFEGFCFVALQFYFFTQFERSVCLVWLLSHTLRKVVAGPEGEGGWMDEFAWISRRVSHIYTLDQPSAVRSFRSLFRFTFHWMVTKALLQLNTHYAHIFTFEWYCKICATPLFSIGFCIRQTYAPLWDSEVVSKTCEPFHLASRVVGLKPTRQKRANFCGFIMGVDEVALDNIKGKRK